MESIRNIFRGLLVYLFGYFINEMFAVATEDMIVIEVHVLV